MPPSQQRDAGEAPGQNQLQALWFAMSSYVCMIFPIRPQDCLLRRMSTADLAGEIFRLHRRA